MTHCWLDCLCAVRAELCLASRNLGLKLYMLHWNPGCLAHTHTVAWFVFLATQECFSFFTMVLAPFLTFLSFWCGILDQDLVHASHRYHHWVHPLFKIFWIVTHHYFPVPGTWWYLSSTKKITCVIFTIGYGMFASKCHISIFLSE